MAHGDTGMLSDLLDADFTLTLITANPSTRG